MKRRRSKRNPPSSGYTAQQIGWTIAITALTAATGAVVIWYVNKKLTPPPEKPALNVNVTGEWADAAAKAAADAKAFFTPPPTGAV